MAPIEQAANEVWTGWGSGGFSQEAVWAKVVLAGMSQGKTIESLLPACLADRDPERSPGSHRRGEDRRMRRRLGSLG
jgi:hypothetical protein